MSTQERNHLKGAPCKDRQSLSLLCMIQRSTQKQCSHTRLQGGGSSSGTGRTLQPLFTKAANSRWGSSSHLLQCCQGSSRSQIQPSRLCPVLMFNLPGAALCPGVLRGSSASAVAGTGCAGTSWVTNLTAAVTSALRICHWSKTD